MEWAGVVLEWAWSVLRLGLQRAKSGEQIAEEAEGRETKIEVEWAWGLLGVGLERVSGGLVKSIRSKGYRQRVDGRV